MSINVCQRKYLLPAVLSTYEDRNKDGQLTWDEFWGAPPVLKDKDKDKPSPIPKKKTRKGKGKKRKKKKKGSKKSRKQNIEL